MSGRSFTATLFLGKAAVAVYQYNVPLLSIVTDNLLSWMSGKGERLLRENKPTARFDLGTACIRSGYATDQVICI